MASQKLAGVLWLIAGISSGGIVFFLVDPLDLAIFIGGAVLAVLLALELGWALSLTTGLGVGVASGADAMSSVQKLGEVLFTKYMFAFEVTSILIIVAMVGAVVLARKREE